MGFTFNPFLSSFDITGGGPTTWGSPVATEGNLPVSGVSGEARVVQDTSKVYIWDTNTSKWIDTGTTVSTFSPASSADGLTSGTIDSGNITYRTINLNAATSTTPGGVSTTTQTFAGNKTFTGSISASNLSGTNTGDVSLTTVGSSPNPNAAVINTSGVTQAFGTLAASGLPSNGDTFTVTIGVHTEVLTFKTTPTLPNDILISPSAPSAVVTRLNIVYTSAELVASLDNPLTIRVTAGSSYPGTAGNGSLRLQKSSAVLTVGNTDGSGYAQNGVNAVTQQLQLQPADGTNPGVVTAGSQTIGGAKTFSGSITVTGSTLANGGLDVTATGGTDTLAIGTSGADVINIGHAGATVNIQGTTNNINTTDLNVTDKLTTINVGGSVGSASNSGVQIEEGGVVTAYAETSADRNSWILKAPNQAGVATISPGSAGITLDGTEVKGPSSSVDNTLPRFDGLTGKLIQTSSVVLSDTDQLSGITDLTVTGTTTLATSLTGPLKATSGVVSTSNVSLTTEVTGTLPIANGGTNSSTALNNNRIITSQSGALKEAAALTDGQLLIGSTGAAPVAASITAGSGISVTNGAGAITVAMSVPTSTGDITQTSFTAADNQATPANVTSFSFSNASIRGFSADVSIVRSSTYAKYDLEAIQKGSSWEMSQAYTGDDTGIVFSINNSGQVQYTSTNTGSSASIKFRAITLST